MTSIDQSQPPSFSDVSKHLDESGLEVVAYAKTKKRTPYRGVRQAVDKPLYESHVRGEGYPPEEFTSAFETCEITA
jgi:hypothetical protein